jgi:hypothetical protein
MKSICVILLTALILFGCREECGCDSEPYRTVNNVEAKLYFENVYILVIKEHTDSFAFCNIEIVPEEILSMSEEAGLEGIDVIVSGDLHKECKLKMDAETPPSITLTDIKLPEK